MYTWKGTVAKPRYEDAVIASLFCLPGGISWGGFLGILSLIAVLIKQVSRQVCHAWIILVELLYVDVLQASSSLYVKPHLYLHIGRYG